MSDAYESEVYAPSLAAFGVPMVNEVAPDHPSVAGNPDNDRRANGQPKRLVCKYDPTHGPFNDPAALGRHYREAHPAYTPLSRAGMVQCRCGRKFKRGSLHYHMTNVHAGTPHAEWSEWVHDVAAPFACDQCNAVYKTRAGLAKHRRRKHGQGAALATTAPPTGQHHGDVDIDDGHVWNADEVTLLVVRNLALPSGVVPIDKLGVVFRFRDATADLARALKPDDG